MRGEILYGFGHRFHKLDPRAQALMSLCDENAFVRQYVTCTRIIDKVLDEKKGVRMNIEAAGGAILLDLGFPIEIASLIILVGRGPMFGAAYMERLIELRKSGDFFPKVAVMEIVKDGK